MHTLRPATLAAAAAAAACCLSPPSVSDAFMIPTSAAAGRSSTPLSARTNPLRRSATFDNSKQASPSPSRISATSGSSKPLSAKPAPTPEAATPAATTGAPSAESVPSSAAGGETCDSSDGSAPTFSYRKTFWQPFLPAEKSGPAESFPRSTATEDRGSSESSTPANDPPTFLYRKTFWQPFAGAAAAPTAAVAEAEAATADTDAAAAAVPAVDESAPSSSAGREATGDSSDGAAPTFSHRKTFWQPFMTAEKSSPAEESFAGSAAAGRGSSDTSTPANDPPTFLYRKTFWQQSAGAAAAGAGAGSSLTDSAKKGVESSSAASPAATDATATPETPVAAATSSASAASSAGPKMPATAEAELPTPEKESSSAGVEESAAPLPAAGKADSAPPPPVSFEPEPVLISDSPVYQGAALNLKRAKEAFAPFTKKIQDNVAEGNFGERGEEWAIAQGVIIFCLGMGSVPVIGGLVMLLAGPGLVAAGAGVIAAGAKGLGKSLSPWPAPVEDNKLNTDGIYGMMRHPMYTGVVMLSLGFGVLTDSPMRMLLAVTLALVLDKKAAKEEDMLLGLHGEAYADYRKTVAKFVPRIY